MDNAARQLTFDEEFSFEDLVLKSVRSRYAGDLERIDDAGDGGVYYRPFDVDHVRYLLIALWGEYLTPDQLDVFEQQLREDSVEREDWGPKAWCDEDLEEEAEREARYLDDYELECATTEDD